MQEELQRNIRYVFYYPSSGIGGAQLLFARLAEQLIKNKYDVLVLEYDTNCFISKYLNDKNEKFEQAKTNVEQKYELESNDILVLSLSYYQLYINVIQLHAKTRLVFWDLHPYALLDSTAFSKFHKVYPESFLSSFLRMFELGFIKSVKEFVRLAHVNQAIYFMALENFKLNKKMFNLRITPNYLPIPVSGKEKNTFNPVEELREERVVNIAWLSRLDADKTNVLELLIKDVINFNKVQSNLEVKLHVIGTGTSENILKEKVSKLSVNIIFVGKKFRKELDDYLHNNIDIGFAIGTSVLEFADRKIPSVIAPSPVYENMFKQERKRYLWLFNSKGFGVAVKKNNVILNEAVTFHNILTEFLKGNPREFANNSYDYLMQNHAVTTISKKFIDLSKTSTLTFEKIENLAVIKKTIGQIILQTLKQKIKK